MKNVFPFILVHPRCCGIGLWGQDGCRHGRVGLSFGRGSEFVPAQCRKCSNEECCLIFFDYERIVFLALQNIWHLKIQLKARLIMVGRRCENVKTLDWNSPLSLLGTAFVCGPCLLLTSTSTQQLQTQHMFSPWVLYNDYGRLRENVHEFLFSMFMKSCSSWMK